MIEYFKNAKVYKLHNMQVFQHGVLVT